ncbi:MAG: hypothetical protein HKP30_12060, partial [Myxococcales bacterium]|nr:hypothetical protein [Myxococcales bacterium]
MDSASNPPANGPEVQEHLPGEPPLRRASPAARAARLALRVATTLLLAAVLAWLWPIYLLLAAIHGWAPNVPRLRQVVRYLRHTWTVAPPSPGLGAWDRAWLSLSILQACATVPLWGTAWLLDELLYGRALRATPIVAPLIEISAARSGSTQLARYLEEDPHLVAPAMIQCM